MSELERRGMGDKEKWEPVKGFPNYQVSSFGRVKSFKRKAARILSQNGEDQRGYPLVCLHGEQGSKTYRVHILVAQAFLGDRPNRYVVRHLDGNKRNNQVTNLCYGTYQENANDSKIHGTVVRGERVALSKLTEDDVRRIRVEYDGPKTQMQLAKEYGVRHTTIGDVLRGKTWSWVN